MRALFALAFLVAGCLPVPVEPADLELVRVTCTVGQGDRDRDSWFLDVGDKHAIVIGIVANSETAYAQAWRNSGRVHVPGTECNEPADLRVITIDATGEITGNTGIVGWDAKPADVRYVWEP